MCEFLIFTPKKGTKSREILATFRQLFEKNSNFFATFIGNFFGIDRRGNLWLSLKTGDIAGKGKP